MIAGLDTRETKRAAQEVHALVDSCDLAERRQLDLTNALTISQPQLRSRSRRNLLAPGTQLRQGRYEILEVLGSGGEGVVYRAEDRTRQLEVALKVLHVDDVSAIPRLKQEFRFLRDLVHPGLVQLYELDIQTNLSFFTMSFIEGVNFLAAVEQGADVRRLVCKLSEVVVFLHETGRIHRDIKPNNLIVRPNGDLILLDFGIGLDLRARAQAVEVIVGTPRYMAPEILRLESATPKSDAYAIGVLLFEALTGEHPSKTGKVNLAQREAYDPGHIVDDVPEDLRHLTRRLTEPVRKRRSSVAEAFLPFFSPKSSQTSGVFAKVPSLSPPVFATACVGRNHEIKRLEEAFQRVTRDRDTMMVQLESKSGMGKTSTLNHFLQKRTDAIVLHGSCSEHELISHNAVDGVVDCLIDYLSEQSNESIAELIPVADALLLFPLFPSLARVFPEIVPAVLEDVQGDTLAMRQRAYRALGMVLARLASALPLVIGIDDLQWGDLDSGKLLYEVFSSEPRPPCLLVLAYRSEEQLQSACLEQLFYGLNPLSDQLLSTTVKLLPLVDREARALVNSVVDEASLEPTSIERLLKEASGSPLLLAEIASHLKETQQEFGVAGGVDDFGMDEIVRFRVARLSDQAHLAFGLLCCSGTALEVGFLAELAGAEPERLFLELSTLRLARGREGRALLEVFHNAIRGAHLRQIASDRPTLHHRLAEGLLAQDGDPAEIARHFHQAADSRASEWAVLAAEAASQSFALGQAVELYRLALSGRELSLTRRIQLRERLADALADAGKGGQAAPIYASLAETAPLDRAIEFRGRAAEQWLITGNIREGLTALAQVHAEVGLTWPKSVGAALTALLYHRARLKVRGFGLPELSTQKDERSNRLTRQLSACKAAWPLSMISTIHGAANSTHYVRLALKAGDRKHLALGYAMEAMYLATAGMGERERSENLLKRARELVPKGENPYNDAFLIFARGQCDYLCGKIKSSLKYYPAAEDGFIRHCRNVSWELNAGRILWEGALFYQGKHRELNRRLEVWSADALERGDSYLYSALLFSKGTQLLLGTGQVESSLEMVDEGAKVWISPHLGYQNITYDYARAMIHLYQGEPTVALSLMNSVKRNLAKSFLDKVHVARVQTTQVEALALLQCARASTQKSERRKYLKKARHIAKNMHREQTEWTTAFGLQIEASVDLLERPTEGALARLREAAQLFDELGMALFAAGANARVGELLGGDEGKVLLKGAQRSYAQADCCDWLSAMRCHSPSLLSD